LSGSVQIDENNAAKRKLKHNGYISSLHFHPVLAVLRFKRPHHFSIFYPTP